MSSSSERQRSQSDLKQAVEEQLDLILKMEEDRKALKRENKSLNEKYHKAIEAVKKYTVLKVDRGVETELFTFETEPEAVKQSEAESSVQSVEKIDRGCQADLVQQKQNMDFSNNSKLHEAMSFLKAIDTTSQNQSRVVKDQISCSNHSILQNEHLQKVATVNSTARQKPKTNELSGEIVRMSKEITSLRRELKEAEHKLKQKQKQHKESKKCLETTSRALQKSRKEFNQLSTLLNTDKYKSIRILEAQTKKYKEKAMKVDEQADVIVDLKGILASLTEEYDNYRVGQQNRVGKLICDLKGKSEKIEELEILVGQCKNEMKLMQFGANMG